MAAAFCAVHGLEGAPFVAQTVGEHFFFVVENIPQFVIHTKRPSGFTNRL
jgi:hypothetical protein